MDLEVTTAHDAIRAVLTPVIEHDPVRGTILGTILSTLDDTAWCASAPGRLAVRSSAEHPLTVIGPWDDAAVRQLIVLLRGLGDVRAVSGAPDDADRVASALADGRAATAMNQRLFRLDDLVPPEGVPGAARVATAADRATVRDWYFAFMTEAGAHQGGPERAADVAVDGGHCWLWCDPAGAAVSMAARRPVIAGSARIGPVYTPREHRRHGYGAAVTAAATRSILAEGAVPVLFTDLDNPTSNKIYQQLGYRPVEDRRVVRLS